MSVTERACASLLRDCIASQRPPLRGNFTAFEPAEPIRRAEALAAV